MREDYTGPMVDAVGHDLVTKATRDGARVLVGVRGRQEMVRLDEYEEMEVERLTSARPSVRLERIRHVEQRVHCPEFEEDSNFWEHESLSDEDDDY